MKRRYALAVTRPRTATCAKNTPLTRCFCTFLYRQPKLHCLVKGSQFVVPIPVVVMQPVRAKKNSCISDGSPPSSTLSSTLPETKPRPWQQEAFAIYRDAVSRNDSSMLLEATPGAGKTTAALVLCLHQLQRCGATQAMSLDSNMTLSPECARVTI